MPGLQDSDNIWVTLEENFALLMQILLGDENEGFKFKDFSDVQNRRDIMNLYYV